MIGYGIFFFTQNTKASAQTLPSLKEQSDYSLSPLYLLPAIMGWQEYNYQEIRIKYPSDWKMKSYNLGKGELVSFSRVEQNTGSSIFFGKRSHLTDSTCDQYLEEAKTGSQTGDTSNSQQNSGFNTLVEEGTITTRNKQAKAVLFYGNIQGYSLKALTLCLKQNDKEYIVRLMDSSTDKKFSDLKNFILMLNNVDFI